MGERKRIRKEVVSIDVSIFDEDQISQILKTQIGGLADCFRKSYEDVNVAVVEKEMNEQEGSLSVSTGKRVVIYGTREETQEEVDARMGIDRNQSWDYLYSQLAECSLEEAKEEMMQMIKSDLLMPPEKWIEHKVNKVKEMLNDNNSKVDEEKDAGAE